MISRVALLVWLDSAMLLMVCVLECLALTGLDLHVWLGFALCPLVLVHVVMQWQWFFTQFMRARATRDRRVRVNALLNLALLIMMSAVLLSGVLAAPQVTSLIGESFGRFRIWTEIHGWLNFLLVVLVGLHLALNWDWMVAALRRRRPERPGLDGAPPRNAATSSGRRTGAFANFFGRGLAVLLIALLSAGTIYFWMAALMHLSGEDAPVPNERAVVTAAAGSPRKELVPQPRPASLPHGVEQLLITMTVVTVTVVIGRYVFRLRL